MIFARGPAETNWVSTRLRRIDPGAAHCPLGAPTRHTIRIGPTPRIAPTRHRAAPPNSGGGPTAPLPDPLQSYPNAAPIAAARRRTDPPRTPNPSTADPPNDYPSRISVAVAFTRASPDTADHIGHSNYDDQHKHPCLTTDRILG